MAITYTYTYLGKTSKGYQIWEGLCTFLAGDLYDRNARPAYTFAGVSAVKGILGMTGYSPGANLGNPVAPLSISGKIVTIMVLETGAMAGVGLNEKTDDEAFGAGASIRCTIYGL